MKRATLLVNPAAGRAALLRAQMPAMLALLRAHGYETDVVETTVAGAVATGAASLLIACGGDGTVHAAVQAVAQTEVSLGVIPLGTANALARNLRLPMDLFRALETLLRYTPRRIPLGQMVNETHSRWFALMAGCGPDGALAHSLSQSGGAEFKRRFGRQAYYAHAARLFLTRRWPAFQVSYRLAEGEDWQTTHAVALIASRVPDLGGVFSGLTRRARMMDERLHVQVLRGPAQLSMPAWMAGMAGPWLKKIDALEVRCASIGDRRVFAQADAEPVGSLPMTLRVVRDALSLLMPEDAF